MGNLKFSIYMLKKEKLKSIVYIITMAFTISVTFLFFNIIDNPYLMDDPSQATLKAGAVIPFSTILAFMVIMFCAAMICFANNFYVSRKTKEIAIMEMSGSGFVKATMYLFYQNVAMTLLAMILGFFMGALGAMVTNSLLYQAIDIKITFFYLPLQAFFDTIIYVFIILVTQLVYVAGYIHRNDIALLLSQEQRNDMMDTRLIKIPKVFYIFLYIIGLVFFFTTPYSPTSSIFPSCVGALGIGGIIKYCLSSFLQKIKQKKYVASHNWLISLSNLNYSMQRSIILINIYGISIVVLSAILISYQNQPREMLTTIIGFFVVVLLLLTSIIYKYSLEANSRRVSYLNMYKLGYTKRKLKTIIKQEVCLYYCTLTGFPFIYILSSLILGYIYHFVTLSLLFYIVGFILLSSFIAAILTYFTYKKTILSYLKRSI